MSDLSLAFILRTWLSFFFYMSLYVLIIFSILWTFMCPYFFLSFFGTFMCLYIFFFLWDLHVSLYFFHILLHSTCLLTHIEREITMEYLFNKHIFVYSQCRSKFFSMELNGSMFLHIPSVGAAYICGVSVILILGA